MMTRFVLFLVALLAAPVWGQSSSTNVYHNRSAVTNQMVIAETFINDGYFEVQNLLLSTNQQTIFGISNTPYDMSDVKDVINNGTIVGTSMLFETVDEFANRTPLHSFLNSPGARIDMADGYHLGSFPVTQDFLRGFWSSPFSLLRVDALSITNRGLMRIGAGGLLRLGQTNYVDGSLNANIVDVSSGLLVVDKLGYAYGDTVPDTYDQWVFPTTFLNDLGVYEVWWGMGTYTNQNQQFFVQSVNPTIVNVPQHNLTNTFGTRLTTAWSLDDAQPFGFQFFSRDPTNIVIQAVFVQTGDTNVVPDVRWYPAAYTWADILTDVNNFWTPIVELKSITTNALTFQAETNAFYIADQLGSANTNFFTAQNDRYPAYFRPANYFVKRSHPIEFDIGSPSNITINPTLFYFPGISNAVVTNSYAGYVFNLENLAYTVPPIPDASVHDLPGRVEIMGRAMDLTGTGIRAEGLVAIKTDNLISTTNTIIDAQNLSFNLTHTDNATPLRIENLAKDHVARLRGTVELWSGVFTNQFGDANSNVFNLFYHVLVVDARGVTSVQEVSVADFQAKTASLRIQDNMIVSNQFDISATDVTIAGNIDVRNIPWGTNVPNLVNLTVESTGSLRLVGLAEFGTATKPLGNFINQGDITAYSESIVADNVDVTGSMRSGQNVFGLTITPFGSIIFTNFFVIDSGPLSVTANRSGRFTGAEVETLGSVTMNGPVFKFDTTRIDAGSAITFNVTSTLVDSGPNARNVFSSSNSFSLNTPVSSGSLLGTEIHLDPPALGRYRFNWSAPKVADPSLTNVPIGSVNAWIAATNRAYNVYSTNVGVGHLILNSGTNTVFEFSGTQQQRALYVDLLDITGPGITNLASLTNQLRLLANASGSIDIYYADVVATNLQRGVNTGFQNMAEFLNGKQLGGGHLYWIPTFNGPNTSEDVVINGTSVAMNRALRRSQIIDMDQDGIANGNDDLPFQNGVSALQITSINLSQVGGNVAVSFNAFQGTYQVQYTESMDHPVWKLVGSYTNSGTLGTTATITDSSTPTDKPRFYRLIFFPSTGN